MVTDISALICFIIWLVIGIITAVIAAYGREIPKITFFCALIIVLIHFFEKAFRV